MLDNVRLAGQLHRRHGLVGYAASHSADIEARRRRSAARHSSCFDLFGLQNRALEPADCLSYGHQRHLEIVRAWRRAEGVVAR